MELNKTRTSANPDPVGVSQIQLTRKEGYEFECVTMQADSFEAADKILSKWAKTAPGKDLNDPTEMAYHKVECVVTYEDGLRYGITYPLTRDDVRAASLRDRVEQIMHDSAALSPADRVIAETHARPQPQMGREKELPEEEYELER